MEHSALDLQMTANMLRAATACNISALVRVPGNDADMILRVVQLGPDGILIPHVQNAQDARRAVTAAKYAPVGDRGMSAATRSSRYGVDGTDFLSYAGRINRELIIFA